MHSSTKPAAPRKPAAVRMTDLNLADAANDLGHYIRATFMAAEALLDKQERDALQIVLYVAEHKLAEIQTELDHRLHSVRGAA
jgi:hypothetical protein